MLLGYEMCATVRDWRWLQLDALSLNHCAARVIYHLCWIRAGLKPYTRHSDLVSLTSQVV